MKRIVYILNLWLATLALLSLTVNQHHHHHHQICFVIEECMKDGHINDQHTGHMPQPGDDTDMDHCAVENAKTYLADTHMVQQISQSIADHFHYLCATLPQSSGFSLIQICQIVRPSGHPYLMPAKVFRWSEVRRGPPFA